MDNAAARECRADDGLGDGVLDPARAVKPDGKPPNRNAVRENAAAGRTSHSTLAYRMHNFQNLPEFLLRAGPRAVDRHRTRHPSGAADIPAASLDSDSSAPVDGLDLQESLDTAARHATVATGTPPAGTPNYSSGLEDALVETTSRSPLIDTAEPQNTENTGTRSLDQQRRSAQTEEGPWALVTHRIKSREEGANFFPRRFPRSLSSHQGDLHRVLLITIQFTLFAESKSETQIRHPANIAIKRSRTGPAGSEKMDLFLTANDSSAASSDPSASERLVID